MLDRAPEFLFENVGSHGDVMPFLNVAAELARRGRRCQLLANEHFRPLAEAHGVGFHAHTTARTHARRKRTRRTGAPLAIHPTTRP